MEQVFAQRVLDMKLKRKREQEADCEKQSSDMVRARSQARTQELDNLRKLLQLKKDLLRSRMQLVDEGVPQEEVDRVLSIDMFDDWINEGKRNRNI
mmetsp:Transcript_5350/g.8257  ORF Transcript_5350/g.8257 Transcript_5350/m.8257 type:complete len:96 (-) Transcript_5350:15-302(-)